jgi:5-oxoprolinase (ATP-hydrolysing)
MQKKFTLAIDTGGTFTDCIAWDNEGNQYRQKVLSNGSIRGNITQIIDNQTFIIQETWGLKTDILQGYEFRLLTSEVGTLNPQFDKGRQGRVIEFYDFQNKILKLKEPLTEVALAAFALSAGEEAPILAARLITQTPLNQPFPPIEMKLGSTKGTNALLENKGAKIALFITKGFKDLLKIGTQQRPDIFALKIHKPQTLPFITIEVEERISAQGEVIQPLILPNISVLEYLKNQGVEAISVAFLNACKNPTHEIEFYNYLKVNGLQFISLSTKLSGLMKLLPRTETAVVNAYLAPIIDTYLKNVSVPLAPQSPLTPEGRTKDSLPSGEGWGGALWLMSSAGSLLKAENFRPKDSLLSGPAGGIVGAAKIAQSLGYQKVIGFDMGGTSTDTARFDNGFDYQYEVQIGNAHIFSPALRIETVASGGGSLCYFDGFKLNVGPESAGAYPGPACYGAGGGLTITDVNLLLGRLDTSQFGIPIFPQAAESQLNSLLNQIQVSTGQMPDRQMILEGFLKIANEKMAGAVKKISTEQGFNPSEYALVAFGGAGGLHACAVADLLDIRTILIPQDAGLLSAYGISEAKIERIVEKQLFIPLENSQKILKDNFKILEKEVAQVLENEGLNINNVEIKKRLVYLRFQGQESSLETDFCSQSLMLENFKNQYQKLFGHWVENRMIEIESIRVLGSPLTPEGETLKASSLAQTGEMLSPSFDTKWKETSSPLEGKGTLLTNPFCAAFIEKNWLVKIAENGTAILSRSPQPSTPSLSETRGLLEEAELFTNRFKAIAENMGAMLQRTALSVNVKERLDFSCALLDAQGELIANAPHIPVHLGSLGVCVREVIKYFPLQAGDTIVTNHPRYGGSHLPDVTLITPVFLPEVFSSKEGNEKVASETKGLLVGYVVNRAHHAEIGGIRPASMPPNAQNLAEEGVVIEPFYLIKNGQENWQALRDIFEKSPYPTRAIEENLADLQAQRAANWQGQQALIQLVMENGLEKVQFYMQTLKDHAAQKMQMVLSKIPQGIYEAEEFLDDGSPLRVKLILRENTCTLDFSGSAGVHSRNLNANEAIVQSVVMYILRVLLQENIPLNDGLLYPIKLIIPENSILKPYFPKNPLECPAVVGGNTETSQRLTDTLFKAFGILACGQGTMNNVLFGNQNFGYYETIGGGTGAGADFAGADAVHSHMTNTRITDPEVFEHRYPVRLKEFFIRKNSGGKGEFSGGNGIVREIEFLESVALSILTQHRIQPPYGLQGGENGKTGKQIIIRKSGQIEELQGIDQAEMEAGDILRIETPGGGGFGKNE